MIKAGHVGKPAVIDELKLPLVQRDGIKPSGNAENGVSQKLFATFVMIQLRHITPVEDLISMATGHENTIKEFFEAWSSLNVDRIIDFFSEKAVFHNIPLEPATGKDSIRKTIDGLFSGLLKGVTQIKIEVLRTVSSGGTVFDERVDSFELNGKWVALPVVGVFEMAPNGKIIAWRDYFDLETLMKQIR
jgi:limonene-1,2-epoxide hydrolase